MDQDRNRNGNATTLFYLPGVGNKMESGSVDGRNNQETKINAIVVERERDPQRLRAPTVLPSISMSSALAGTIE